jgi:hypothetical protein
VVDHQAHGYLRVFVMEQANLLAAAIFEYLEVLALKLGHCVALVIAYCGPQHYQGDIHRDLERSPFGALLEATVRRRDLRRDLH